MALYRTEGIILRSRTLGEADKILTIFTKEKGKIETVARGARRPRNRLVGASQQFSYIKMLVFGGKGLDQLSQAEILRSFVTLRDDLIKMAYASWWSEILDVFLPLGEVNSELFLFTLAGLLVLEKVEEPAILSRAFELRLLKYLGYEPALDRCVRCNESANILPAGFSLDEGGILCQKCWQQKPLKLLSLSNSTLEVLNKLTQVDLRIVSKWNIDKQLQTEIDRILISFIQFRAEKPLKSLSFLQGLLSWD